MLSRTTPVPPFCDETELALPGEDGPPLLGVGVDGASVSGGLGLTLLRDPVGAMKDAIGTFPDKTGVEQTIKVQERNPFQIMQLKRPSAMPVIVCTEYWSKSVVLARLERLISCHMHAP